MIQTDTSADCVTDAASLWEQMDIICVLDKKWELKILGQIYLRTGAPMWKASPY